MELRPIFSALLRNKIGLILIGMQMALTLAIVVNALYIIQQRLDLMGQPSGLDESNIFTINSSGFASDFDVVSVMKDDLRRIRQTPGVVAAFATNAVPLTNSGWASGLQNRAEEPNINATTAVYFSDEQTIDAYGVKLIAGRNFLPHEIQDRMPETAMQPDRVILTEEMARTLYPEAESMNALIGQRAVFGDPELTPPVEIIGIIEHLRSPWSGWANIENRAMLVPFREMASNFTRYVVRTEPGDRDRLMPQIETMLTESNSGRIVRSPDSFEDIREGFYRDDRAIAILLGAVVAALLLVTGLGIVGLVSFWVTQRIKQIGTRRALGASRPNILSYFLTENLIIAMLGVVIGSALAYLLNALLMSEFGLPRITWYWVPVGAAVVVALGQIATLGPARRAARVSPAIATRTV